MKTRPRELLLARHQAMTPKLDAIRRSVVDGLDQDRKPERVGRHGGGRLPSLLEALWAEVFRPTRQTWLGLAAIWLVIGLIHIAAPQPAPLVTDHTPVPALQMLMAFENAGVAKSANGKKGPRENRTQPRPRREGRAVNVQHFASSHREPVLTSF